MNLHSRLRSVERERGRRCVNCGGPLVAAPPRPKTWRAVWEDLSSLSSDERIAMHAHMNQMHLLPPALQERAYHMYCDQQGIPYVGRTAPYSDPDPPPAPWFPDDGPVPKYTPKW